MRWLVFAFFLPSFIFLWILEKLFRSCSSVATRDSAYSFEAWKFSRYVFKGMVWFIGEDKFYNVVEQRRREMAKLFGVRPDETVRYVPKACKGEAEEDQPVFLIKFLSVKENAAMLDELFESRGFGRKRQEKFMLGKQAWLALRTGLQGWINFTYEDGTLVEWDDPASGKDTEDRNRIMDKNLDRIPPDVRAELAEQIKGESSLGEAE